MARVHFNQALIADLRHRVIDHNQEIERTLEKAGLSTRLEELKLVYKRAYGKGKGANPGAKAMAKVEGFLDALAKGERPFDEAKVKRDEGGQFAEKSGGAVAPSVAEHRARQGADPEYRARTTAIIPDKRFETIGAMVRDTAAFAAGTALTVGLLRGRSNSLVARGSRWLGGVSGSFVLKIPTLAVVRGGVAVTNAAASVADAASAALRRRLGRINPAVVAALPLRRPLGRIDPAVAYKAAAAMGGYGRHIGKFLADVGIGSAGAIGRAAVDGVTVKGATKWTTKARSKIQRAVMTGGLAIPPSMAIRSFIQGSLLDPAIIGRGIDPFSHREIEKLDAARGEIMAKLDGVSVEDALSKAGGSRLWSAASRVALPGLAALGGVVAGGAAARMSTGGQKKGNPYRDEDGQFTSKDRAVMTAGGAIAGAAVAGLAAYAAMRRGNIKAFAQSTRKLRGLQEKIVDRIRQPEGAPGSKVEALMRERTQRIRDFAEQHEPLKQFKASVERFGASTPLHFAQQARDEVTAKIADQMVLLPAARFPGGGTVREAMSGGVPGFRMSAHQARGRLLSAIDRADPKAFDSMIAGLSPTQKKGLRDLHALRENAGPRIATAMEGHADKILATEKSVAAATTNSTARKSLMDDARVSFEAVPEDHVTRDVLKAAHIKQSAAFDRAAKVEVKGREALQELKANPSGAVSLLTGKPLRAPDAAAISQMRSGLESDATGQAVRRFQAQVEKTRAGEMERAVVRTNRLLAAQQMVGVRGGITPKGARYQARRLAVAGREVGRHNATLRRAEMDLSAARRAARGDPKNAIAAGALHDAQARAAKVRTNLAGAELRMNTAAAGFNETLANAARAAGQPGRARQMLRNGAVASLRRDLARVRRSAKAPIDRFIASPTGERLGAFAAAVKRGAQGAQSGSVRAARAVVNHAFKIKGPDGQMKWSAAKIAVNGFGRAGLVGGLGAGGAAAYEYARDLSMGPPDGKKAAAFPIGLDGEGRAFEIHQERDPITGAGYVAVSVRDPQRKGERLLLWGERDPGERSADGQLVTGARMGDVKRRVQEERERQRNQNQGGGNAPGQVNNAVGFGGSDKEAVDQALGKMKNQMQRVDAADGTEGSFSWRPDGDNEHQQTAAKFSNWLRNGDRMSEGGMTGDKLFQALGNGLFTQSGSILKPREAYGLLTGFSPDGSKRYPKGILPRTDAFGADGNVAEAMTSVVDKVLADRPNLGDWQRTQLHRAVTLVGKVKGLRADQQKLLHTKIREGSGAGGGASVRPVQATLPSAVAVSAAAAPKREPTGAFGGVPLDWDEETLHDYAATQTTRVVGMNAVLADRETRTALYRANRALASYAKGKVPSLSEADATEIAGNALAAAVRPAGRNTPGAALEVAAMVMADLPDVFYDDLDKELIAFRRRQANKAELLDDFDALMKAAFVPFDETKHRRDKEGEFSYRDGREGDGSSRTRRRVSPQKAPEPADRPLTEPVRLGTEVGGVAAGQAAWMLADRFLPASARFATKLARTAGVLGAATAASIPGSQLGQEAGEAVYRARGQRSPGAYEGPDYAGAGDVVADLAGNLAGSLAGAKMGAAAGALAGPGGALVGGFLGGAAGGLVGGDLTRVAYRYLAPYGSEASGLIERYLGGGMRKVAPDYSRACLDAHTGSRIDGWLAGYGPLAKRASRHFAGTRDA